ATGYFIAIGICAVMRGVLHYGEQNRNHYIAFTLLAIIRDHVFGALRRLAPAKMDQKNKGELVSTITSDIELLEVFYAHTISPIAIAVITSIVMLVFFGMLHPLFILVALLAYVTVGAVLPLVASRFMSADGVAVREDAAGLSGFILDSLRGLSETLRYGQEKTRGEALNARSEKMNQDQGRLSAKQGREGAITDIVILLFSSLMLLSAILLYNAGAVDARGVLLSVVGMMSSFGPVAALSALAGSLTNTLASGERVLSLLEEEPEVKDVVDGRDVTFTGMDCEHISFSYDGKTQVLRDFDLTVPEKGITGITGPSGSGKSTALKMLMRFRDVQAGSVDISGEDIRGVNTTSLRRNQAYVTQETQLFNDTIENNIRIARMDATHDEVVEAAKKASVHDFILTLPRGYDTGVGELGDLLSSGEKQRIGLARAFLSDAPLILLDEPTSNLDTLNEGHILHTLDGVRKEKSIVLVSHRPSVKAVADRNFTVETA
ncbi:MAG: ABC transporter ATP-binding protein, partial [Clostridia bacterium]|nr:ABC transporter ATP-binding protein [Clostridia bacterium]